MNLLKIFRYQVLIGITLLISLYFFMLVSNNIFSINLEGSRNYVYFFDESKEETVLKLPVQAMDIFNLGYTHSMYKSDQWEFYEINQDLELVLLRVEFETGNAADYYERHMEQAQQDLNFRYGKWGIIKNQAIEQVDIRVPYLYPMIVEFKEEAYDLRELSSSGSKITMFLKRGDYDG